VKYIVGVDLGQVADYTAVAVLERIVPPQAPLTEEEAPWSGPPTGVTTSWKPPRVPNPICRYTCGHLERLKLNMPYPDVVEHVAQLLGEPALAESETALVVDATGVGKPVVDMLERAKLNPIAITIHGGDTVTREWRNYRVPKRDLIGTVQVLLQTDRLKFAGNLPAVPQLVQELTAYRVKIDPLTAHDSYNAREGAHDDLILAVAIGTYYGEQWRPPLPRRRGLGSLSY
jgi:hypothetical protein